MFPLAKPATQVGVALFYGVAAMVVMAGLLDLTHILRTGGGLFTERPLEAIEDVDASRWVSLGPVELHEGQD